MPIALLQFNALIIALGAASALVLLTALIAGLNQARYRIWPCPPAGSARSVIYWSSFRILNITVVALALIAIASDVAGGTFNGIRFLIGTASAAVFAIYLRSLWALGHDATYCSASGLNTAGIYAWSRNPQYATAIVGYALMAVASFSAAVAMLALALIAVYALMALNEEPWLDAKYGTAYARYRANVPRFFNVRRALQGFTRPDHTRDNPTPHANSQM